jgi:hypothetical protein
MKKLLIIAGCGLALSACGSTAGSTATGGTSSTLASSSTSTSVTETDHSTIAKGQLSGVARLYGGPIRPDGTMGLDGDPGQDVHVTVSAGGKAVATLVTGVDGTFTFDLPPGRYVVKGCTQFHIVIEAGRTTTHDLTCPVP